MAMDPYDGHQTHFEFHHFDLEPVAFSRPVNDPYYHHYDPGWRNPLNFSWEAPATRNSTPYSHRLHNQANPQFNNQAFYLPSDFHPHHPQWHSSPYRHQYQLGPLPPQTFAINDQILQLLNSQSQSLAKLEFQVE
jgi:hypothetical protein